MLFSTDEASNKAVIYAGVPPEAPNGFNVLEWLTPSIAPLKGRGGGGKNGLAQGQVSHCLNLQEMFLCSKPSNYHHITYLNSALQGSDASQLKEAMELATQIAKMKLS